MRTDRRDDLARYLSRPDCEASPVAVLRRSVEASHEERAKYRHARENQGELSHEWRSIGPLARCCRFVSLRVSSIRIGAGARSSWQLAR